MRNNITPEVTPNNASIPPKIPIIRGSLSDFPVFWFEAIDAVLVSIEEIPGSVSDEGVDVGSWKGKEGDVESGPFVKGAVGDGIVAMLPTAVASGG